MIMAGPAGNVTCVCLLIALSRVIPDVPLLVAANRDERYDRPAQPVTVLRGGGAADPRRPGRGGRRDLARGQ